MLNGCQGVLFFKLFPCFSPNVTLMVEANEFSFVSSVHSTLLQKASVISECVAYVRHWLLWWDFRKYFSSDNSSIQVILCKQCCTVDWWTPTVVSAKPFWRSLTAICGFSFAYLTSVKAVLLEIYLFIPDLALTSILSLNCHFLKMFLTVEISTWKHLASYSLPLLCFLYHSQLLRGALGCWE